MPNLGTEEIVPATFPDKEAFKHFKDPTRPQCFACNSELLKVAPLKNTPDYMVLPATMQVDGEWVLMNGCWLVFPRKHVTSALDMPYNWHEWVNWAIMDLGLADRAFCVSENWGRGAGQTIQHAHTWIIQRGNEEGLLSEDHGLATILHDIRELHIPND